MIQNKKSFLIGVFLAVTFFLVLVVICSPVFNGMNGLQYADRFFNSIAKGSTYYIPEVREGIDEYRGQNVSATIAMENVDDAKKTAILFEKAGAATSVEGSVIKIGGDLGGILAVAIDDADMMFKNEGDVLTEKYGYHKKDAMYHWWLGLHELDGVLKKQGAFAQAAYVDKVVQKAIEPAYNFYGIKAEKVGDYAETVTFMLVFYVVYTLWWGFAVYYLFDGIGFGLTESAKKAEV